MQKPVVLTIAGSDSGGGAGIQADLKTFNSTGSFGTSVITCLTAQNPDGVTGILEVDPDFLEKQLVAVLSYFPVKAIKTGMLFSESLILRISKILKEYKAKGQNFKLVIDPVMVATSGAKLLQDEAIQSLISELVPMASLVTPNLDEAKILGSGEISKIDSMESETISLAKKLGVPVLLKGGHIKNSKEALDVLGIPNGKTIKYTKPFVEDFNPHGTGCTYSSAIASYLAQGFPLSESVPKAREFLHAAILQSFPAGKTKTLNHNPKL
ncbi:bifunctional hydroxymethylpyrimidine kinase/phosphomethylpyrimidine kinase [Leptospira hartskeerlii]|uniref:hydroxymethylpyrimidine kinase n=1 Tax=Leptospira hartskeerlii TaxID=2023177 RepID=A0A2M9XHL6_9LEPT|nr:bifunctional hydroxymethylpyrimidine kinase/phosphomethylpyrimidine kinase [Leptospira hartskeerlii]PJZ27191.1 bifunctional hydroxymethylpyrimidine kinase/phosphomethylpyrimidine kinase [Leptospira hartskeerlii]PJZ33850.1 bifunctional hydroxymethylpyrimidine kinase/phosphomethylpyrimidine kinase [Leptospira hartskeerlii]